MSGKKACIVVLTVFCFCSPGSAGVKDTERPFLLWTEKDVQRIRTTIESEPWAKKAWADLRSNRDNEVKPFRNLLNYAVFGDEKAGQVEKRKLMKMVNSPVPQGMAQWINCIRYDQLHGLLSSDEKAKCEKVFRNYIRLAIHERDILDPNVFNDSRNFSRYDARKYNRYNWLPNIIWPRKVSANLMAVVLRDEKLIRETWKAYGSMKWYFDHYLADKGFYMEEFGKMGSTPGAMLIYCRGLDRLGLGEMGYGYTGGRDESGVGASMRGHIESLIDLGYPMVELHSSRPHFPRVTIGDLRQSDSWQRFGFSSAAFQQSNVMGYLARGRGGQKRWTALGAWGGEIRGNHPQWDGYVNFTPKMLQPMWFEIAHKRWPDAGFGYFLAWMRGPDEDRYIPSLFFGLEPIDPDQVQAPPAPSAVWPERGIIMLRAKQDPEYWTSPKPAVSMRTATPYAHSARDSFAIAGFYARKRPILLNRQTSRHYARGWSRSARSHNTIIVDDAEPAHTTDVITRSHFGRTAKFATAASRKIYADVDLSRSLVLTDAYLLDVTSGNSDRLREWTLLIHALGVARPGTPDAWKPDDLPGKLAGLENSRRLDPGSGTWRLKALQHCALEDPSKAKLPAEWYRRGVGDLITVLGRTGTEVYLARTPRGDRWHRDEEGKKVKLDYPAEIGGITLAVRRKAPGTRYVVLHQPFENNEVAPAKLQKLAEDDNAVLLSVRSDKQNLNDRILLDSSAEPRKRTLVVGSDRFTFTGYVFLRSGSGEILAEGNLHGLKVQVSRSTKLVVNGQQVLTDLTDGVLTWSKQD